MATPPSLGNFQLTLDPSLGAGLNAFDTSGMQLKLNGPLGGSMNSAGTEMTPVEGMSIGGSINSAITTISNSIAAGIAYSFQKSVLDIQAKMQEEGFQFQVDSSEIAKEMKIDLIGAELEKQGIQQEGQKLLNAAVQNRAKVEGDLAAEKAIKKDAETTKKFAETKTNKGAIARMFSAMRSEPFYGRPVG